MNRALLCVSSLLVISTTASAAPAFAKRLAPPKVFDGIRAGMTVTEAQAALGTFAPDGTYQDAARRTRLVKDAGDGAKYYVLVKGEVISRIGVEAPERGLVPRLGKLWGAPLRATNLANEEVTSWNGVGWRVDLSCRNTLCRMAFHQALTPAYFGGTVQPPGALAGLRPGMTRDDVAQLSPRHLAGDVPAGPEDVRVTLDLVTSGHLRSVLVGGLPAGAGALLEKSWGTAAPAADGSLVWFNPDRGWRAVYNEGLHSVQFSGYVPATKLLGAGPGIALLAKPILGATREQILAAYPLFRADRKQLTLALPPTEGGVGTVDVSFDARSQRVTRLAIQLPYDSAARRDELIKLMAAKWGTPRHLLQGGIEVLAFPTDKISIIASQATTATATVLELVLRLP
ncbi:MAG: hypothetical protein H0X17_02880 [Deltaproteobacteria bacterium]|nr:hypothetical protein [Deltaproteobacteria bacterium]